MIAVKRIAPPAERQTRERRRPLTEARDHVLDFYTRHPISRDHILAKIEAERGSLDGLTPEELWPHDQDHYGGLAVNDALAARAQLAPGNHVVDFCAGLGGPARYFAHRYGVTVTGIELNPTRAAGANDLTRHVGLAGRVEVIEGDVTKVPLADGVADAVVSQEALLHVPNKRAALREAHRLLKSGGRLAFTDWITHRPLADDEAETMWRGIAAQTLMSVEDYRAALTGIGFTLEPMDDLTSEWGDVLAARLAMYRRLREETRRAGMPTGDDAFYSAYEKLVALVQGRVLGGGRFVAVK
jgi:cyclopropane fatty-acyl-phospholipid synthase-like methyltransferase